MNYDCAAPVQGRVEAEALKRLVCRTGEYFVYKVLSIFHFRKRNQIKVAFCPEWLYPRCVVTGDSNHWWLPPSHPADIHSGECMHRTTVSALLPLPAIIKSLFRTTTSNDTIRTNMIVGWIRIFANAYRAYTEHHAWFPFGNTELCRRRSRNGMGGSIKWKFQGNWNMEI